MTFIQALGIVSPLGEGLEATRRGLFAGEMPAEVDAGIGVGSAGNRRQAVEDELPRQGLRRLGVGGVEALAVEGRAAGTPVEPLVRALRAAVGGDAERYVHRGATSQDIVDSAAMLVAAVLALIGPFFAKKVKKSQGPQKVAASVKETAGVLPNAKPHPRPAPVEDAVKAVARSSS